ncbi:hypothetical protein ACFU7Y_29830 [Kitasatospora sp. NPDC057542]|uniref:hypothetical protein n=1 Tax=Kitasatospora sp. NPDC057542 TaxID=3346162 RepID=UPI0036C741B5
MTNTTTMRSRLTSRARKALLTAAALTVASSALIAGAGQAQAASSWSNGWGTYSNPFRCTNGNDGEAVYFCLYYNSGANGAVWKSPYRLWNFNRTWTAPFERDQYGSNGAGQRVYHNAASAENDTNNCNLGVYSNWNTDGDVTWIPPLRGGNLNSYVKNKNESAALTC